MLAEFEEVELLDLGVVAFQYFFHFLVKGRVVASEELFVADVRVDQPRTERFSIHRCLW